MEKEHISPWLIAFRIIFTVALIACIGFIFGNSLEDATLSSLRSEAVMQKLNALLARLSLGPLSMHTVRKLAHFAEFTLLGFLLMLCLRVYTARFVRHTGWPLLGGMTTALADETIQLYIPGRTSQVTDVWLDMAGVVAGLFVALLLLLIVRLIGTVLRVRRENRELKEERERYMQEEHARLAHRAVQRARREGEAVPYAQQYAPPDAEEPEAADDPGYPDEDELP